MSTIQETVTSLTDATTTLLEAVNIKKSTLDQGVASATNSASSAASSASAAEASAGQSAGSVAQALAIYGTTNAFATALTTAQSQVSVAAGYAASAGSVSQQDLSGVTAAALHRSPNAVTAMFIYDTSKDSDGGAWRKRMGHTSWMNEPLSGKWLGAQTNERNARDVNAILGAELITSIAPAAWTMVGTSTYVQDANGSLVVTVGAIDSGVQLVVNSLTVGQAYKILIQLDKGTITASDVGLVSVQAITDDNNGVTILGFIPYTFIASSTSQAIKIRTINTATSYSGSFTIKSLSVKSVISSNTVVNDYFKLTTDGKFYKLNITSGITEVFRGNKAEFPALSAIVAEAGNVTIYDLTDSSRAMWRSFTKGSQISINFPYWWKSSLDQVATSVCALNSTICIGVTNSGDPQSGLLTIEFAKDRMGKYKTNTAESGYLPYGIATYQSGQTKPIMPNTLNGIIGEKVFAVAMTVLPDAPFDSVTGLQIPTIAVGTNGGVSVIKSDGTVVNDGNGNPASGIIISQEGVYLQRSGSAFYQALGNPNTFKSGFLMSLVSNGTAPEWVTVSGGIISRTGRGKLQRVGQSSNRVQLLVNNESLSTSGIGAAITDKFNTGYLVGDIKRAWLAENSVGSIAGTELVINGTFDTDISGWVAIAGVASFESGKLKILNDTAVNAIAANTISNLIVGKTYLVVGEVSNNNIQAKLTINGLGVESIVNVGGGISQFVFTAINTSHQLRAVNQQTTINGTSFFDNISVKEALPDRSYKAKPASIFGTLTKSQVAIAAQLVAFSGFSAVNYLRETEWSSDLDFGTGSFSVSSWVNVPAVLPVSSFPSTHLTAGDRFNTTDWTKGTGWVATSGTVLTCDGTQTSTSDCKCNVLLTPASHLFNRWTITVTAISGSLAIYDNNGNPFVISAPGTYYSTARGGYSGTSIFRMTAGQTCTLSLSVEQLSPASIVNRSAETGSSLQLGLSYQGVISTSIFDGTTTQTVTSPAAYNNGSWVHASAEYSAGALKLKINGTQVAQTTGAALLSLNNSLAVATVGNNFALNAPFPGSLALVKVSATIPTNEQAVWMYEQEKQMFRDGAQCCLPDSNNINDLAYDELLDKWTAVSSTNESSFTGLIRTSTAPVSAGSISKVSTQSGVKLLARISTSPGVDITIPAQGLREELVRRGEAAAAQSKTLTVFDFDSVGFTASTTSGSALITAVASVVGTPAIGMGITGAGIPAGTTIIAINGTTYTLSASATATAALVALGQNTFDLPLGFTATEVLSAGGSKREGATRDWVRLFDGFKETIRFGVSPGSAAWVQITSRKA